MRAYLLMAAILGLLLAAGGVHAQQKYPTKPIRLIVPFPAGGGIDRVARMLAQKLSETFKQSVVVDNRPGGGATIGTETAVRANPDGYTMILVSASYATNASLYKLPYDPVNDVVPIALIGESGYVVTVHPSGPVTSIQELIAYGKANPGKLDYGTGGTGSSTHLVTELFNQMAGVKMTHVPYKGAGAGLSDLLGGQIQLIFATMPGMIPQVKSNRLRGIAVTTAKRSNAVPEIPTVAETVPGYEAVQWYAVLGPKALPKDIAARWNREIGRILQLSDVKQHMAGDSIEPAGGSPERFREVLKRDVAKWQKVVKIANIKPGS
ncbi:MAG: tripartite tricarboxylate transporter substrate binding protein [Betaproteobacteria bacterium]|nr:tripartite tricarboxylate transporter substrate binding protein [Betaproteobacteria bacterium]